LGWGIGGVVSALFEPPGGPYGQVGVEQAGRGPSDEGLVGGVTTRIESADATFDAYTALGFVEPVDIALVDHLVQLAEVLDELDPTHANYPKLINAYAAAEAAIHKRLAHSDDSTDDFDIDVLLAPVRDEAN
jgi:hypothetical protein